MDSQRADLYRVLGLSPDASGPDIARAYRQQARAVHPDTRPGDPDALVRFRALTDAYEVLSDPDRRDAYDRQRRAPAAPPPPAPMAYPPAPAMTWLRPASRPAAGAPLWAGPVHVQPPAGPPRPGGQDQRRDAVRAALAAYLIRRYLAGQDWL